MELFGYDFEYAGISSKTYGMIFANVDTSRQKSLVGQTNIITIFNNRNKKRHFVDTSYESSALSFEAEVVCKGEISATNRRQIEKWLFGHTGFQKLYVNSPDSSEEVDGEVKRLYLNCKFINPSKVEANGVVGYRFTVECDTFLAWQDSIVKEYELNQESEFSSMISVDVDSDIGDYVYPKVTIKVGSEGGTILLVNHSDSSTRITQFVDLDPNITIEMNGAINYVSDDNYDKFAYKNFIRLLTGENSIYITGNVQTIKLEWQNMRYL